MTTTSVQVFLQHRRQSLEGVSGAALFGTDAQLAVVSAVGHLMLVNDKDDEFLLDEYFRSGTSGDDDSRRFVWLSCAARGDGKLLCCVEGKPQQLRELVVYALDYGSSVAGVRASVLHRRALPSEFCEAPECRVLGADAQLCFVHTDLHVLVYDALHNRVVATLQVEHGVHWLLPRTASSSLAASQQAAQALLVSRAGDVTLLYCAQDSATTPYLVASTPLSSRFERPLKFVAASAALSCVLVVDAHSHVYTAPFNTTMTPDLAIKYYLVVV